MDQAEQARRFAEELEALVVRYRREYDLTLASVVGVLEVQKHALVAEALGEDE